MHVFVPKEMGQETRAALDPQGVKKLKVLGLEVSIEAGLGAKSDFPDAAYEAMGAVVCSSRAEALRAANVVLRINKPSHEDIALMQPGTWQLSFLDPFNEKELLQALAAAKISAVSLEMIPRTTLAQKMDVLSSQANLAGYYAVLRSATELNKVLPMMMTPAGTLQPARYFIVGVGVAGLQAIATAKRLGARVEAFDTRSVVEEQVKSLGARFVKIDLGDTGQTAQGYAQQLTPEQIQKQRDAMAKVCSQSDVVITTAKVFGRKAPTLITRAMLDVMQTGSIVIDLAVESGGNVEGSRLNEVVTLPNGVRILGIGNAEGNLPNHATQMFSSNLTNFLEHFWSKETKQVNLSPSDDFLKQCLITHNGNVVHEKFH
ncbi:MAG: NAD(P) transhydrogenase subunit alpha [Verrucomicrobia bacterium GWF2_51_19]|nr:MAG: NAD(P) transhydrogenase subunit alpha [Verrucomicrobia bacterium GWF2_51_19]HCJ12125.1 NAD(P)(+) transhydrogenase (Re/Si-specific) subunit alpha [Opitutae bacterium]